MLNNFYILSQFILAKTLHFLLHPFPPLFLKVLFPLRMNSLQIAQTNQNYCYLGCWGLLSRPQSHLPWPYLFHSLPLELFSFFCLRTFNSQVSLCHFSKCFSVIYLYTFKTQFDPFWSIAMLFSVENSNFCYLFHLFQASSDSLHFQIIL